MKQITLIFYKSSTITIRIAWKKPQEKFPSSFLALISDVYKYRCIPINYGKNSYLNVNAETIDASDPVLNIVNKAIEDIFITFGESCLFNSQQNIFTCLSFLFFSPQ